MAQQITSQQYSSAKQSIRNLSISVNLLDSNYMVVDNFKGYITDGNVAIHANSDIRRTCEVTLVVSDSSFDIQAGGKIWLDKAIQIYCGINDIRTQEIAWNNMGIFLINQPTFTYDATTKIMRFQGVDLMARMTGLRNGTILGIGEESFTLVPEGSNVREVIIDILDKCGFNNYYVEECMNSDGTIQEVPYDMKFDQGSTWYNILEEIRDILPYYQIYFDVNGVFRYEKIPYTDAEPIMIDQDIWKNNVISETVNIDFENVKNVVEIWGRVHETDYFSDEETTTIVNNIIRPTWTGLAELEEYIITAFSLPSDVSSNNSLYIDSLGRMLLIKDFNGNLIKFLPAHEYLTFTYSPDGYWIYLGGAQAHAVWKDENPESPFYVNGSIGEVPIILYGEDYENIVSDDLALERAKYEIYKRCRLNDTINLTTVPIYWADVNWKVAYSPLGKEEEYQYMIQSINLSLLPTGTQTFELSRFYPLYPII